MNNLRENAISEKSMDYAEKVIHVYRKLRNQKEFILANQFLRSGTSIGANIAEAKHAQSRNDFINKLSISQKETTESRYWLELLYKVNILDSKDTADLLQQNEELQRILTAIIRKLKSNPTPNKNS